MNNKGLSLGEVLAVVVIAGVLASVAFVAYTKTVRSAKDNEALAAMQAIAIAEREYLGHYNKFYPSPFPPSSWAKVDDEELIRQNLKVDLPQFINNQSDPEHTWTNWCLCLLALEVSGKLDHLEIYAKDPNFKPAPRIWKMEINYATGLPSQPGILLGDWDSHCGNCSP